MYTVYKIINNLNLKVMTVNSIGELFEYTKSENFFLIDGCIIKNSEDIDIINIKKINNKDLMENYINLFLKDNFETIKSALLYFHIQNKLFTRLNYDPLKIKLLLNKESYKYSSIDEVDIKDGIYNLNITYYRYFDGLKHTYSFDFGDFNVTISNDKLKKCLNFMLNYLNDTLL